MNALKMIIDTPFLAINKELAKQIGLDAAIIYAELASAQKMFLHDGIEDWFFRTGQQIQDSTTLSAKVQRKAFDTLKNAGLLKTQLKGCPATLHFKIDAECVQNLSFKLCPNGTTSYAKKEQQDVPKLPTIKKERKRNISLFDLPESISEDLKKGIQKFFEYRVEIGKKFKSDKSISTKVDQFIQQAEKYSEKAVLESIDTCIANGWQGTFISKEYLNQSSHTKSHNNGTTNQKSTGKESIANFIKQSATFELD